MLTGGLNWYYIEDGAKNGQTWISFELKCLDF